MIKDSKQATEVLNIAWGLTSSLNSSLKSLDLPSDELKNYKSEVGFLMAEIYDRLIDPLLTEHPDLIPESYKSWFKPNKKY